MRQFNLHGQLCEECGAPIEPGDDICTVDVKVHRVHAPENGTIGYVHKEHCKWCRGDARQLRMEASV